MYNSSFYNKKDTFSGNYINVYNFVLHNNQILNILYSSFDSNSKLKILDIGGGTGVRSKPLLNELRKRNDIEYWGIDISEN
jgi:ubiquinone/menaquinone biosynthesis C-methylase UbiE